MELAWVAESIGRQRSWAATLFQKQCGDRLHVSVSKVRFDIWGFRQSRAPKEVLVILGALERFSHIFLKGPPPRRPPPTPAIPENGHNPLTVVQWGKGAGGLHNWTQVQSSSQGEGLRGNSWAPSSRSLWRPQRAFKGPWQLLKAAQGL